MRKYKPQPGDIGIVTGSGIASFIVRLLTKILFRLPWEYVRSHTFLIFKDNITIEADSRGVGFYTIDKYKKVKSITIYRHKFYQDKRHIEQYLEICKQVVDKGWKYGYANYFHWYIGVGIAYYPLTLLASLIHENQYGSH